MELCENCKIELTNFNTCYECGLVITDRPLSNLTPMQRDKLGSRELPKNLELIHPHTPHIVFLRNNNGKEYYSKSNDEYKYMIAYTDIIKYCKNLKLPNHIKDESLSIYKYIRKQDPKFFIKFGLHPSYLAFIRIACKINGVYIDRNNLIEFISHLNKPIKKFNKSYMASMEIINLNLNHAPDPPTFIDFVGSHFDIPYKTITETYKEYKLMKPFFNSAYKIEGYILAIFFNKAHRYKVQIADLIEKFDISTNTIMNRKRELRNIKHAQNL